MDIGELGFHVLIALAKEPAHGYAIGKEIQQRSGGRLDPTTGALYQALKRLTAAGYVRMVDVAEQSDARRKHFELTAEGRRAAEAEARRLDALVQAAREQNIYPARA